MSNIWPKADEYDERNALASVIWSYQPPSLATPISGPQSLALADAVLAAGWVNLEKFRHDTTNTLGMRMVHELYDPDLGYDRGIADAMDIVNERECDHEEWDIGPGGRCCVDCGVYLGNVKGAS